MAEAFKNISKTFPLVTRERLKVIDRDTTETGDGSTNLPTEIERAWLEIMRATDSERESVRKKISVCALADIVDANLDLVSLKYGETVYTIKKPANGLKIAKAREISATFALEELNNQRQIVIGAMPIEKDFRGIDADVVRLLVEVADSFFFMPYI